MNISGGPCRDRFIPLVFHVGTVEPMKHGHDFVVSYCVLIIIAKYNEMILAGIVRGLRQAHLLLTWFNCNPGMDK